MIYIGIAAAIFIADFLIKEHMERTLSETGEKKKLRGFIRLRKHHNKGAFLNVGEKRHSLVAAISVLLTAVITVLFVLTLGNKGSTLLKTGLSLLLGGAFSNTYDRLKRKYVVDYLSFGVKWKRLANVIFNFSDFGIIVGALLMTLSSLSSK